MHKRKLIDLNLLTGLQKPRMVLTTAAAGNFRHDGQARTAVLKSLGLANNPPELSRQVHSRIISNIHNVTKNISDGQFTAGPPVAVTVADCMPIFVLNTKNEYCTVLHSGWKGTGILSEALKLFINKKGASANDITLVFGPSIRNCCYEVDYKRAALFALQYGAQASVRRNSGWYLDLVAANLSIAHRFGVGDCRVLDFCTQCNTEFGSFRREGKGFTSMAAIAWYDCT